MDEALGMQRTKEQGMESNWNGSLYERPPVNDAVSDRDAMWSDNKGLERYLAEGWSVGRTWLAAQVIRQRPPKRILDFGCGHGRVMR